MARLTTEAKTYIVTQLACFATPSDVQAGLLEAFGLEVAKSSIVYYDPTTAAGAAELADEWRELFETTRRRYSDELTAIPIATRGWRLRQLARLYEKAEAMRNYLLAAALLEQAARDAGGSYTNQRELTGKGGAPLVPDAENLTDAEREARADAILARALARRDAAQADAGSAPARKSTRKPARKPAARKSRSRKGG